MVQFSETDLMNHVSPSDGVTLPSTLNLYAVYQLSKTTNIYAQPSNPLFMPNNIPYATPPQTAVPEFNAPDPIWLIASLLTILAISVSGRSSAKRT
jgi:hypothetical protein